MRFDSFRFDRIRCVHARGRYHFARASSVPTSSAFARRTHIEERPECAPISSISVRTGLARTRVASRVLLVVRLFIDEALGMGFAKRAFAFASRARL